MKTTLRSSNTLYRGCALPMDIFDDEMVRVVLHMASDVANFGCIPIFVITSPRVSSEGIEPHVDTETSFRANMSGPDNEEEVLPRTISLQQYYSPIHDNYDNIDDNGVTLQDVGATIFSITTSLEQRYSPYHNNNFRDNDDFHDETEGDNVCAEPSNNMRGTHFNNNGDDGGAGHSNVPSFQHEDECKDNTLVNNRGTRPISSMVRSRRRIDSLTSLAPTLPSNMVAPNFVSSCDSDDISVGMLFAEKNEFILQLCKVAFRDKFDFKIARSTTTRFEAHCCSESCKWRIRTTRCSNEQNIPWVVRRIDNVHTCHNEEYDVQLTYKQAYRAREVGLEIVRGNPAESYNLLPKYSHILTTANESTVTHLEQDGDGNFLYYFVPLRSSIKGFMQYIRSVIVVDGTHLKRLYRGSMFVATCLDGNNQLYPLAIGIMDSENNDAWEWFMMKLHGVIGDRPELVRTQFEGRRYNILTTNIAESVNFFMREPRKFPVTHLVDHFRKTLQQWFYDRKIVAESMSTRLTTWADEIVTERRTIAERMIVRPVSPHRFQVIGGGLKEGLVDLQKKTCSCRVFQLDQLEMQVYPPVEAPPPGRCKELRIPSADEDVNWRTVRCGRYHELGHNSKRCKNLIASTQS
ncbi:SWIM-type domain-containing protein [Citrus sinensis]|nr:SWIM-type domain-containing protein [Citrus sinensis]